MGVLAVIMGSLALVGLLLVFALAIPALVLLVVSPRTRGATMGVARFLAWLAGCIALLGLIGWFAAVQTGSAPDPTAGVSGSERLAAASLLKKEDGHLASKNYAGNPTGRLGASPLVQRPATAGDLVSIPAPIIATRPKWVDQLPTLEDQTYRVEVKSGLYVTPAECQRALSGAIAAAVDRYVATYFGDDRAAELVDVEPTFLWQHLIRQPLYAETVDASVGPMQQLHALLEFDDQVRAEFHRLWRRAFISDRLRYAGGAFALLLAFIGTLCGYLRFDIATGGAYTRRLRWAAGLAILLVVAGAVGVCVL